jgi:RHS repeat-associated protein
LTLYGATYTVDNAGNRSAKSDLQAGLTTNYGYDATYQLLTATQGASTTESYSYDPVGNRLSSLGGASYSYNPSNELTATSSATYGYDNNGNAVTKNDSTGVTAYGWDFENRLTSVTLPGSGGTVSFKYDPFGRRIYKSSTSGTSIFAYDGDNLIEETNSSGAAVARYSQGLNIDEPLAMLRLSTTSYYNADGLGSITSLSNGAGSLAQTYGYDSFGKQTTSSGSLTNPFQYTGRESDTETGLYYYRARYYDSQIGRFLSEDPIGLAPGPNVYAYVRNRPIGSKDPSGMVQVVPLPDANIHRLPDIDSGCRSANNPGGETAGGCEAVGFSPNWECKKTCFYAQVWQAKKVTLSLNGDIYVATGRFPYKGRHPADPSVRDTAGALAHEQRHVSDKLNAILPIYEQFESRYFHSKEECDQAGIAATAQAVPAWAAAGALSQQRRH